MAIRATVVTGCMSTNVLSFLSFLAFVDIIITLVVRQPAQKDAKRLIFSSLRISRYFEQGRWNENTRQVVTRKTKLFTETRVVYSFLFGNLCVLAPILESGARTEAPMRSTLLQACEGATTSCIICCFWLLRLLDWCWCFCNRYQMATSIAWGTAYIHIPRVRRPTTQLLTCGVRL